MKSRVPKVLQTVGGSPMIIHVLDTAMQLNPAGIHIVFNPDAPEVRETCKLFDITWAPQAEQLGTGHAVLDCEFVIGGAYFLPEHPSGRIGQISVNFTTEVVAQDEKRSDFCSNQPPCGPVLRIV